MYNTDRQTYDKHVDTCMHIFSPIHNTYRVIDAETIVVLFICFLFYEVN